MILWMQIAVVLQDEQVAELDELVPHEFSSRAEAVRTAVASWLALRQARDVDRRYQEAYAAAPPPVDDIDSGRLQKGSSGVGDVWRDLDW